MALRSHPPLSPEAVTVLMDLNPWWEDPDRIRPLPPEYRRPVVRELAERLRRPKGLIEVVRGPRQVGKTTGIYQIIQDLLRGGTASTDVLFIRLDLELLRAEPGILRSALRWYEETIRRRHLDEGPSTYLFLDEVHKLRRWQDEIKHLGDTFPLRILLTGSSSVLVARGGRESLTGRVFTTELPAFSFREVLECWKPELAAILPAPIRFARVYENALRDSNEAVERLKPQQKLALRRALERYYSRGGYPRLYTGEVEDDRWADYLLQTVFESVLGSDIPDLFPVDSPGLLRFIYLQVARLSGNEIAQNKLAMLATEAGIPANQPTVGKYLRYLADALLIREFRRYPLAKKASARVPTKITVSDLGVRNAIFRGAPSLWESDPGHVGSLVETLVQGCIRDHGLNVHFFRQFEDPANRRSRLYEVDFVAERADGAVLPVEVKFRRRIDEEDGIGLRFFATRYRAPLSVMVTRETSGWDGKSNTILVPLLNFLLAF